MIRKFLLIGESILQFYLSQDDIIIDHDILSGFCQALYSISLELTFPLRNIGFKNNRMIIKSFKNYDKEFLVAVLFEEYHIDEGIKKKIEFIFNNFFKKYDVLNEDKQIKSRELENIIRETLNDLPLKRFIKQNINIIIETLEPILWEKENNICAYCLTSSCNNLLYFNSSLEILKNRPKVELENIIKEYLFLWRLDKIPQGDQFTGSELPAGLDLTDYINTGQKTHGIVINTSINLKEEPNNELLLYLFGKNMLMRSCVPDIEETLRKKLIRSKN